MKGMQAISRGSGFGGTVNYGLVNANGDLEGRIIGGNMSGTTAKELSKEFGLSRKLRPDIKKPVWHNSLRSPKDEKLTDEQFNSFADDYMKRMGFTDAHQRVYMMHDDEKGRHIHIVASRIGLDGTIYYGKNENLKSSRIINRLEKVYGLVETKAPNIRGNLVIPDVKRPAAGETGKFKRTGETPERHALAQLIDTAIADKPTASAFAERLALAGVEVRANFNKYGLNGFSFKINNVPFKGSQLGSDYTGQALIKRGLTYVPDRDYAELKALNAASRGPEQGDAAAKDLGADKSLRSDRAVDSTTARDTSNLRRTDSRTDRADHGADHADPGATAGRPERFEDERPGVKTSADTNPEASREASSLEADSGTSAGTERPAAASPSVAPSRVDSAQRADIGDGIASGVEISSAGLILTGDKGTDELLQAAHSGRMKAEREGLARQKKHHAEDLANAKKRQAMLDKPHSSRLLMLADRSTDSGWRPAEIQRFSSALGAAKFQVTCVPANAKAETIKKAYTAEEMQDPKVIKNLAHLSARNYQVNVQPSDSAGVILLKGLDAQDVKKLEAAGLAPAVVVTFAGKSQAWVATGEKLTADERTALTGRIENLVGLEKKAGMAGRMVGFAGASLTAGTGQVAPAAREMLGEVRAQLFEAKLERRLALAIEKTAKVDYVDTGGIQSLRRGVLSDNCRDAVVEATMFGGSYDAARVERGVLEALARKGVEPGQAYRAVFDESRVAAGDERHAADAVAQAYTRVALVKEGKDLAGVDLAAESAKRYPELMKRAESRQDSELKAIHAQGKANGKAESARMAQEAELQRIAKAQEVAERRARELEEEGLVKPK